MSQRKFHLRALVVALCLLLPMGALAGTEESFSYEEGSAIAGQGGWAGDAFTVSSPGLMHGGAPGAMGNKVTASANGRVTLPLNQVYGAEDGTVYLSL